MEAMESFLCSPTPEHGWGSTEGHWAAIPAAFSLAAAKRGASAVPPRSNAFVPRSLAAALPVQCILCI